MTVSTAIKEITRRLDNKWWADKAAEMLRHLTYSNTTVTTVSDLAVCHGWPTKGSIRFTRDADGRRFQLCLKGNRWVGRAC